MNIDALVIGCGLTGSVIARYLAEKQNKRILIVEKREHIAGNMYDYYQRDGFLVQQYGPHVFHTNKKALFDFMAQYSEWSDFYITCMAQIDGIFTPSPFNFQTIDDFYSENEAAILKSHIKQNFGDADKSTIVELLKSEDEIIRNYAELLYEKDYKPYTAKQWGILPEEIDVSVLNRVPVLFSYKFGYFDDKFQKLPLRGYTAFFRKLLKHQNITVKTGSNALDFLTLKDNKVCMFDQKIDFPIIYTGPADELLNYKYGELPYRSVRFDLRTESVDSYQPTPIVAYPQAKDFTRITEYKKLPCQTNTGKTIVAIEYPQPYIYGKTEPYYPTLTNHSQKVYLRYYDELKNIPNLFLCGRLADFKYYNMDQALERALAVCEELKHFYEQKN